MARQIPKTASPATVLEALATFSKEYTARAVSSSFHRDTSEVTIDAANASDLATSLTLVNQIAAIYYGRTITAIASALGGYPGHINDDLAHKAADAATLTATYPATDLATAQTLANEIKADYGTHRASATIHDNADATNTISAADATDQSSLNTLLNELKTDINAHMAGAPSTAVRAIRIIEG